MKNNCGFNHKIKEKLNYFYYSSFMKIQFNEILKNGKNEFNDYHIHAINSKIGDNLISVLFNSFFLILKILGTI